MLDQPVVDQAAAPHRELHRADGQLGGGVLAHLVADRQPGAAVHDRHQVQRALVGGQLGVVGVPHVVRLRWAELPAAQVRCRRGLWVAPGQARPEPPAPVTAHQPSVRISRATRLRPTFTPQAISSSAWILGRRRRHHYRGGSDGSPPAAGDRRAGGRWGRGGASRRSLLGRRPPLGSTAGPVLLAVLVDEPVAGHLVVSWRKTPPPA